MVWFSLGAAIINFFWFMTYEIMVYVRFLGVRCNYNGASLSAAEILKQ